MIEDSDTSVRPGGIGRNRMPGAMAAGSDPAARYPGGLPEKSPRRALHFFADC